MLAANIQVGMPVVKRQGPCVQLLAAVLLAVGLPACSSDPDPAPDVLRVRCDTDGTHVLTPTVAAQDDGVHIQVPESGDFEAVQIWGGDDNPVARSYYSTGHAFDHSFKRPLSPGRWSLACYSGPQSGKGIRGPNGGADTVEVVDPGRFFVPYGLSCPPTDRTGFSVPIFADAASVDELVRGQLQGILDSDSVEPAGYPAAEGTDWRVVRDGDVVGSLNARAEGGNGAILSVFVCGSSGIARP